MEGGMATTPICNCWVLWGTVRYPAIPPIISSTHEDHPVTAVSHNTPLDPSFPQYAPSTPQYHPVTAVSHNTPPPLSRPSLNMHPVLHSTQQYSIVPPSDHQFHAWPQSTPQYNSQRVNIIHQNYTNFHLSKHLTEISTGTLEINGANLHEQSWTNFLWWITFQFELLWLMTVMVMHILCICQIIY